MEQEWAVWARVSGGVTGHREAWLKKDGQVKLFKSEAEAQAEAARWNKDMNGPHTDARFHYAAREYNGGWM